MTSPSHEFYGEGKASLAVFPVSGCSPSIDPLPATKVIVVTEIHMSLPFLIPLKVFSNPIE